MPRRKPKPTRKGQNEDSDSDQKPKKTMLAEISGRKGTDPRLPATPLLGALMTNSPDKWATEGVRYFRANVDAVADKPDVSRMAEN
jgi:hypothetical protein